MKKLLILLPVFFFSLSNLYSQIPNSDMENWTSAPNLIDWETNSCPLCLPPYDPYTVKKDSDPYSGKSAANLYANGVFKPMAKTIFPISIHPENLSLYYKLNFAPCVNDKNYFEKDTVSVLIEILSKGKVVDNGYWESTNSTYYYSQLIIPVSQNAALFDSCRITLLGGKNVSGCGIIAEHTSFRVDHFELKYSNQPDCIDPSKICTTCNCYTLYDPVCGCNGITYGNDCEAQRSGVTSWTKGACGNPGGCVDPSHVCLNCPCPLLYAPVCGCDGNTYDNSCFAKNSGIAWWTDGACNVSDCSAYFQYEKDTVGTNVSFYDASSGKYDSLRWDFGDNIILVTDSTFVRHHYAAKGKYEVCLTVFSDNSTCLDKYCNTIAVAPRDSCIDHSVIDLNTGCDKIYDPVCGCDGNTYENSCEAFYHHGITSWTPGECYKYSPCDSKYYYWLDSSGFVVHFVRSSGWNTIPSPSGQTLLWSFGDDSTSSDEMPLHTYADTSAHAYLVCLTVTDKDAACTGTFCDSIHLGKYVTGCNAGFGFSFDSSGIVVVYPDSSSGDPTGWDWKIGNNGTTNVPNPSFPVDSTGDYDICHIVKNDSLNCTDTVCISSKHIYAAFLASGYHRISNKPAKIYLSPNPAIENTTLHFTSSESGTQEIAVINLLGEKVYESVPQKVNAGVHTYQLNLQSISPGLYFVEIKINNSVLAVRKLVKN